MMHSKTSKTYRKIIQAMTPEEFSRWRELSDTIQHIFLIFNKSGLSQDSPTGLKFAIERDKLIEEKNAIYMVAWDRIGNK